MSVLCIFIGDTSYCDAELAAACLEMGRTALIISFRNLLALILLSDHPLEPRLAVNKLEKRLRQHQAKRSGSAAPKETIARPGWCMHIANMQGS